MKLIERLHLFIKYKGLSLNAFELRIGVGNGYIGKQIKKKGSIGSDILEKICVCFKELNPTWLLTGNGAMLQEDYITDSGISEFKELFSTKEKAAFEKVLDKLSVEKIISYIHEHEKNRGFDKNSIYNMFLKARTHKQVIEILEAMEAKHREMLLKLKKKYLP